MENLIQNNISFAIGSDVAAGTTLSMPYHAKMAIYKQESYRFDPVQAFSAITLNSAKLLGLENKIGSLESGKSADIVFYAKSDLMNGSASDKIADLVFTGHDKKIYEVMIQGKSLYKDSKN